jgi:hypothetical protein
MCSPTATLANAKNLGSGQRPSHYTGWYAGYCMSEIVLERVGMDCSAVSAMSSLRSASLLLRHSDLQLVQRALASARAARLDAATARPFRETWLGLEGTFPAPA